MHRASPTGGHGVRPLEGGVRCPMRASTAHRCAAFRRTGMDIRPRVLHREAHGGCIRLSRPWPGCADRAARPAGARSPSCAGRCAGAAAVLDDAQRAFRRGRSRGRAHDHRSSEPALAARSASSRACLTAPGVYLFYGDTAMPLYVGKSTRLRSRVLSHFCADHRGERELSLSQQVSKRIEWLETSGELAHCSEAQLIKQLQPSHNRLLRRHRDLCAWRLGTDLPRRPTAGAGAG